jgi:hypothetical protein
MAKQKHASEPSDTIAGAHDETHAVALELLDRLSIFRLVYRAIDGVENILPNNKELSAARDQLLRLLGEINNLHTRADLLSGLLSRCMETGTSRIRARRLS